MLKLIHKMIVKNIKLKMKKINLSRLNSTVQNITYKDMK